MLTSFAEVLPSSSTNDFLSFNLSYSKLAIGLKLLIVGTVLFISSLDSLLLKVTTFAAIPSFPFVYAFANLSSDGNF